MKRGLSFCLCALYPFISNAEYLDDKIMERIQQKQDIVEQLEQCEKAKGNLKIAGITTLGISAIGIGANVGQAVKLKKLGTEKSGLETQKADLIRDIEEKKRKIKEEEARKKAEEEAENKAAEEEERKQQEQLTAAALANRKTFDDCTAEEKLSAQDTLDDAKLIKDFAWYSSTQKCAAKSCIGGAYYVLKNGQPDGWCKATCDQTIMIKGDSGYSGTVVEDWKYGGKACDIKKNEEQPKNYCKENIKGVVGDCESACQKHAEDNKCELKENNGFMIRNRDYYCICNPSSIWRPASVQLDYDCSKSSSVTNDVFVQSDGDCSVWCDIDAKMKNCKLEKYSYIDVSKTCNCKFESTTEQSLKAVEERLNAAINFNSGALKHAIAQPANNAQPANDAQPANAQPGTP